MPTRRAFFLSSVAEQADALQPWASIESVLNPPDSSSGSAYVAFLSVSQSNTLLAGIGAPAGIPSSATIVGLELVAYVYSDSTGVSLKWRFASNGGLSTIGSLQTTPITGTVSGSTLTIGGPSNLLGVSAANTPTPQRIGSLNYGVNLYLQATTGDATVYLDAVEVAFYYNGGGGFRSRTRGFGRQR